ncbi:MAG: flagellin, partial [Deltaproteobacteria bacterium]|nr:flagellin [Deltaproteobacteria bacterium]
MRIGDLSVLQGLVLKTLDRSLKLFETSGTALATGSRINNPSDDPAGLGLADMIKNDILQRLVGVRNVKDYVSFSNIVTSGLSKKKEMLMRMLEIAEQSANGSLSFSQRLSLQSEFTELVREYNRLDSVSVFNGMKVFSTNVYNVHAVSLYKLEIQSSGFQNLTKNRVVSTLLDGTEANGWAYESSISANGRYVV